MANLDDYRAFIAVVDQGNLSAAARQSRRSLQAISRALAALENEVGVELIKRTTRRAYPSTAGQTFYGLIKKALAEIDQAHAELVPHGANVEGALRIGCSTQFTPTYLVPLVAAFMKEYPLVSVELVVTDHHADLLADRLDMAVRLGTLAESRLQARQLGALRQVVYGAPSYFAEHGRPTVPSDLTEHACVVRRSASDPTHWSFQHADETILVDIDGRFSANNMAACNAAVLAGMGIGLSPQWLIRGGLADGQLETVLQDFTPPPMPIFLVWPSSVKLPARTRAFIDFLALRMASDSFVLERL